jgi:hypothetical protein
MRHQLLGVLGAGLFALVLASAADAQSCYRLTCSSSQACQANQITGSGKCCCRVSCTGGKGGTTCTCSTYCDIPCNQNCPSCTFCTASAAKRAGFPDGFTITKESHARLATEHLLTAQVLDILSDGQAGAIYSVTLQGKSNAGGTGEDYGYKARVRAGKVNAVLDFAFESVNGGPKPHPVRVMVDEFGGTVQEPLSDREARDLLAAVTTACSQTASLLDISQNFVLP